jgi:hypothetical protein
MRALTSFTRLSWLPVAMIAALVSPGPGRAVHQQMTRADTERALVVARGTDAERARFHEPYLVRMKGATAEYIAAEQVEVITEFRRFELVAEEYARRGDVLGPRGVQDAQEALRRWQGRISIVVHLRFQVTNQWIPEVPAVDVAIDDPDAVTALNVRRTGIYNNSGRGSSLVGAVVEGVFDADAVGHGLRSVRVVWKGKDIGRVTIDFASLK